VGNGFHLLRLLERIESGGYDVFRAACALGSGEVLDRVRALAM